MAARPATRLWAGAPLVEQDGVSLGVQAFRRLREAFLEGSLRPRPQDFRAQPRLGLEQVLLDIFSESAPEKRGIAAVAGFLYEGLNPAVAFQQMASGMSIFSLLAIPCFIFAGEIMRHGRVARRLVALALTTYWPFWGAHLAALAAGV